MKHVLVIEDEEPMRELLAEVFEDAGFHVSTAANGAEALEVIRKRRPDVVLLDLVMPVMDGYSFLRECRSEPACADLAIAIVSSAADCRRAARQSGARAVIPKPFETDTLLMAVERLLSN